MQNKNSKTIGIIGAGIGGLTTAALLINSGHKVTLYEKQSYPGGRALSIQGEKLTKSAYQTLLNTFKMSIPFSEPSLETIFEQNLLNGYTLDLGFHVIGGGVVSNLQKILSQINDHVAMIESRLAYITNDDFMYPFLTRADKMKMAPNILRLMLSGEKKMKELDKVSMTETIKQYGKGKTKLTLELFARVITTVNDLDIISTGETFRAQKNLLQGSKAVGYPKKGLKSISKKLCEYITKNGGIIHYNSPVERIIINDNKACGIQVNKKEHIFDHIICNAPVQDLFTMADETQFPKDYVNMIKNLEGTGSLCAYYALNKIDLQLLGKSFLFIERDVGIKGNDTGGMIDFMTATPESGLSPATKHLVQSYIICTPKEAQDKKILEKLKKILDKNLKQLIPDYKTQLNWAIYPTVWQLDGVAKTIDNKKPDIQTPVKELYLVGDCVKAPGIGINCALNSARILSELLIKS